MSTVEAPANKLESETERPTLRPQRPPPPPPPPVPASTQSDPPSPIDIITISCECIFNLSIYSLIISIYL